VQKPTGWFIVNWLFFWPTAIYSLVTHWNNIDRDLYYAIWTARASTPTRCVEFVLDVLQLTSYNKIQGARPLRGDAGAPARVVGEQVRQAQTARKVERRLHRLAYTVVALVHAEQIHDDLVDLAADARFQRDDLVAQRRFGGRSDPQCQRGTEQRAAVERERHVDDVGRGRTAARQIVELASKFLGAHPRDVFERRSEQRVASGEMVLSRTA
jgi:hypothetical protein